MPVDEEEIMALYAIAREELQSVENACTRLENTIQRLQVMQRNVEESTRDGMEASLSQFNDRFKEVASHQITHLSKRLEQAVFYAEKRLSGNNWFELTSYFLIGVIAGAAIIAFWGYSLLNTLETNQRALYWAIIKPQPIHKIPVKKHKKIIKKEEQSEDYSNE